MKRFVVAFTLLPLLLALTFGVALADMDMEDPVLCVEGQWLTVDAAVSNAVVVFCPPAQSTVMAPGAGCFAPPPAPFFINRVITIPRNSSFMVVVVDGDRASVPTVTATYAGDSDTKTNHGQIIIFPFHLQ